MQIPLVLRGLLQWLFQSPTAHNLSIADTAFRDSETAVCDRHIAVLFTATIPAESWGLLLLCSFDDQYSVECVIVGGVYPQI